MIALKKQKCIYITVFTLIILLEKILWFLMMLYSSYIRNNLKFCIRLLPDIRSTPRRYTINGKRKQNNRIKASLERVFR